MERAFLRTRCFLHRQNHPDILHSSFVCVIRINQRYFMQSQTQTRNAFYLDYKRPFELLFRPAGPFTT